MRPRLAQLHQSGATVGQRPEWTGTKWEPTDDTGGAGGSLPWFVVTDPAYGAVGDGTFVGGTDDTAAINLAIAALNTAGRGVLYFPAPTSAYKITGALTTITAHAVVKGDGAGDLQAQNGASTIITTSTTAHAMTLTGDGSIVEDIAFECSTLTTQTAGSAIHVTQGDRNAYRNVSVRGFYDCINIEDGALWTMTGCYLVGPVRYALYTRHVDLPDGGDQAIVGCNFYAEDRNATSAIRLESGGGLKVIGCKINTLYSTGNFSYGIDIAVTTGVYTSVLLVSGCSIENVLNTAVRVVTTGAGNYDMVTIAGLQVGLYNSGSAPAIELTAASSGAIRATSLSGLSLRASPSRSVAAITMTNVVNATVGDRVIEGFTTGYSTTTSTSIVDGMAGTGSYTDEEARDAIGTALVAGTGIAIAVNDGADTITITSTVTASSGELLMQDGVTAPPVPIENEAQNDWLYAD